VAKVLSLLRVLRAACRADSSAIVLTAAEARRRPVRDECLGATALKWSAPQLALGVKIHVANSRRYATAEDGVHVLRPICRACKKPSMYFIS